MFTVKGLDKLERRLNEMKNGLQQIDGTHDVNEIFSASFMTSHSRFNSFYELLNASQFTVNSSEDFKAIPDDEFDAYIRSVTNFPDWETMRVEGVKDFALRKMGF